MRHVAPERNSVSICKVWSTRKSVKGDANRHGWRERETAFEGAEIRKEKNRRREVKEEEEEEGRIFADRETKRRRRREREREREMKERGRGERGEKKRK